MESRDREEWQDNEISLLDYWRVIKKRKRVILGLVFFCVLIVGFYSYFIATKIYESTASIFGPKETSLGGMAGSILGSAVSSSGYGQFLGGMSGGTGTVRDTFLAILKSRTMAEDLITRFKLQQYYKADLVDEAIRRLQMATDISVSREGVISVKVEDADPKLAADIANAYFTILDHMYAKVGMTDAGRQRAFIEERLEKEEQILRKSEDAMRRFQEQNKAIVLQEQSKTAIEAAARVRGEISAAEVQLEALRSFATEGNPQVVQQKKLVQEMKRQLAQMEYGKGMELPTDAAESGRDSREFHVPFSKMPEVGVELIRLTRDVKVHETVYTLLSQQLEQAKIAEARDTPAVQVLDKAIPAKRKSRPRVKLNIEIAGTVGLLLGLFLSFFLEYLDAIRKRQSKAA